LSTKVDFKIVKEAVKSAAANRWPEIISALGGLSRDILDGRHHPCPKCGGTDRFRLLDRDNGAVYCNQCFSTKNGDGIATLRWLTGMSFGDTLKSLADHLGIDTKRQAKTKCDVEYVSESHALGATLSGLRRKHGADVQLAASWDYGAFKVVRFDLPTPPGEKRLKEFRPLHEAGAKWRVSFPKPDKDRPLYRLPELTAADVGTLLTVHGGEKAVDAAVGLGLLATTNAGGEKAVKKADWGPAARFPAIAIVVDHDDADAKFGTTVAARLLGINPALIVKIIRVSDEPKGDIVEAIRDGLTREKFLEMVDAAPVVTAEALETPASDSRPTIMVDCDERQITDAAIEALKSDEAIFQRSGVLVQVVDDLAPQSWIERPHDGPRIASIRLPRLRELLASCAVWLRESGEEVQRCHPPDWAVKAVDARGQWAGIRRLSGVVESPVLRADGSVLQSPGYDPTTALVYRPGAQFPAVPDTLTVDDARGYTAELLEVVEDFPFRSEAHRSAWLAGVLTPFARHAFCGPAPLFLIDANARGSGKSLLTDVTSTVVSGRPMARMTLPRDDEEFRKRITSLALAAEPLILIDNIAGELGSPSLDAALTATTWSDRLLGRSEVTAAMPMTGIWYATGNNVVLAADTARRTLHVRLESAEENPENRANFHHPNLLGWVRTERLRLAVASVGLLSAYCQAGKPVTGLSAWGSFEGWSEIIRGAIVWCGLDDPVETRVELASQSDRETVALRQLVAGLRELDPRGKGVTVATIIRELSEYPDSYAALRESLFELAPPKDGKTLNPKSIGMKLHHLRRRVVGGQMLDRAGETDGAAKWVITEPAKSRGLEGTTGTNPSPSRVRTHAHTHARNLETTESSPRSPGSPLPCQHDDVEETETHDGYLNRKCRRCGDWLPCKHPRTTELSTSAPVAPEL